MDLNLNFSSKFTVSQNTLDKIKNSKLNSVISPPKVITSKNAYSLISNENFDIPSTTIFMELYPTSKTDAESKGISTDLKIQTIIWTLRAYQLNLDL